MSGFSVKAEQDPLEREQREIERRRQRLEDRKHRILNAKNRIIGVDTQALEQQMKERQLREKEEKERLILSDVQRVEYDQIATQLEQERVRLKKIEALQLAQLQKQQEEERKVIEATKIAQEQVLEAAHLIAPLMKFAGEDPYKNDREKLQKQQQAEWIVEHVLAQQRKQEQELSLKQKEDLEILERNRMADEIERQVRLQKKYIDLQTKEQNVRLIEQKKAMVSKYDEEEADLVRKELEYLSTNKFMTEARDTMFRTDNPNRLLSYHFKGFSTAQKTAILEEQQRQAEESRLKAQLEKEQQRVAEKQTEEARREALRMERLVQNRKLQDDSRLRTEQMVQKQEKDVREQYMNKVVYTNPVSESYFQQFGTSAR